MRGNVKKKLRKKSDSDQQRNINNNNSKKNDLESAQREVVGKQTNCKKKQFGAVFKREASIYFSPFYTLYIYIYMLYSDIKH